MKPSASVLVVSRDPTLLHLRKSILGAYFRVETACRLSEAESQIAEHAFDMVVLCYTLSDDEYGQIGALARGQVPSPTILTLNAPGKPHRSDASGSVHVTEKGPLAILKVSAEILGLDLKGRGRAVPR
jgi:hypothetical protein